MIDYVGLNILAGIYALMLGFAIGRFFLDSHYRKLLRDASEDYNETIHVLREHNTLLQQDLVDAKREASSLKDDVDHWKAKAAEMDAIARAYHKMAMGEDE